MNWADLLDWAGRILGGLAALVGLGLFVILLGNLGKVFVWLGRTLWSFGQALVRLVRSPYAALLAGIERNKLIALVAFPFAWLYEKLWPRPRLKGLADRQAPGLHVQEKVNAGTQSDPPPWNEAPSLAFAAQTAASVPAPLAELVRLWAHGFSLRPLWDLPGSETFFMSYYVYPQLWEPDAPSILVETTKPRNDQPRWRLVVPSGKDVQCIEIDESAFLAWWRQSLFSIKGEMSLTGWVGVYELIRDYCAQCPHDYPRWKYTTDQASTSWRQGIIERLVAYHDAVLYATSWGNTVAHVALWLDELVALHRPLPRPDRDWATNELRTQANWAANLDHRLKHTQSIRLIDLLQTDDGVSALLGRLHEKSMLLGYEEVLDCSPECVWTLHGDRPVCLPLKPVLPEGDGNDSQRVHFPKVWACDGHQLPDKEPIFFHESALIVSNADGMRGMVDRDGRFVLRCRYAYLVNVPGDEGYFEVAEALTQDRGELLCDLIDAAGQRINPAGMKVLAGTCRQTGCVVTTEDESRPLRLDWMDIAGVVRNGETMLFPDGLRWAAVGNLSEGLRQVRCPDSGLWGYLDKTGAVLIPPAFHKAYGFDDGLAWASMEPGKIGLIELDGSWRIAPDWASIERRSDGSFLVKNPQGELHFLDSAGNRLPVPPWPTEIVEEIKTNFLAELNREHDGPFQGIGTMSELGLLMMGLVESHEDPAVAYHAVEIYALLSQLAGIRGKAE